MSLENIKIIQNPEREMKNRIRPYIPPPLWKFAKIAASRLNLLASEHSLSFPTRINVRVAGLSYFLEANGPIEAWKAKTLVGEKAYIEKILESDCQTFIDIGAYNGSHTIPVAMKARYVSSFEPNPICFNALKRNVELNNLRNVETFPFAISNFDGTASLCINDLEGNAAKLECLAEKKKFKTATEVPTARLDSLLAAGKIPHPDGIKIDVEGAEPFVIEGMGTTFRPKHVFIEIHQSSGVNPAEIEKSLKEMGYKATFALKRTPEILCHFELN